MLLLLGLSGGIRFGTFQGGFTIGRPSGFIAPAQRDHHNRFTIGTTDSLTSRAIRHYKYPFTPEIGTH